MEPAHQAYEMSPNGYEEDISTQLIALGCSICGKPLRVPVSIERGWGPICDDRWMGGSGSARVWEQAVHDFDPEETAAAMRNASNMVPKRWVEPTKIARKGQELPDGTKAKGGEVLEAKPLKVRGLHDFWIARGGKPDSSRAKWRHDPEVRQTMLSNGIWYASRAVTFGYMEDVVSAEKVDPKWSVVASVQQFARAIGMNAVADRMTEFYAAKVVKVVAEKRKALGGKEPWKKTIIFEHVPPDHRVEKWDGRARRVVSAPAGPETIRLHVPWSPAFNDLAWTNKELFFAKSPKGRADKPYYWRYFRASALRQVVNVVQTIFGDQPCITRNMLTRADHEALERSLRGRVPVLDAVTQQVRYLPLADATRLQEATQVVTDKGSVKKGRYTILKE